LTLRLQPQNLMCGIGGCTAPHCCLQPTSTPCPTTTPGTCATFACPAPLTLRLQPESLMCFAGGCTAPHCCLQPTTTPAATTTTTHITCATYQCPATWVLRPQPLSLVCSVAGCTPGVCCLHPTTTYQNPCTTVITVAVATTAKAPCSTVAPAQKQQKLYDMGSMSKKTEVASKKDGAAPAWVFSLLATVALVCCCIFATRSASSYTKRSGARTTFATRGECPEDGLAQSLNQDSHETHLLPQE